MKTQARYFRGGLRDLMASAMLRPYATAQQKRRPVLAGRRSRFNLFQIYTV
jgi:hypothetical protein